MTKTDPASVGPPLCQEEDEEDDEDQLVPEALNPTQEHLQKPFVCPSAPAPIPKDYASTFLNPSDLATCQEILCDPQTTIF